MVDLTEKQQRNDYLIANNLVIILSVKARVNLAPMFCHTMAKLVLTTSGTCVKHIHFLLLSKVSCLCCYLVSNS